MFFSAYAVKPFLYKRYTSFIPHIDIPTIQDLEAYLAQALDCSYFLF